MTRVLLVSHKHPLPTDDGKKAVLAGLVAYLVARHGAAGVTYVVIGRRPPADDSPALPCETVWLRPPWRGAQLVHALASLIGFTALSLQEAITRSRRVARELARLCARCKPSLLILDTIRIGQYFEDAFEVEGTRVRRVLYMDDLFHLRFARLAALARAEGGGRIAPAGTFAHQLPRPVARLLAWAPLRDGLYRLEQDKVEQRELKAPERFDACLLINPHEVELLRQRSRGVVPQAIKPLLFAGAAPPQRAFNGAPVFILFGSLRHPVHRASVLRLLGPEGDAVFAGIAGLRLQLVGDGLDDELRRACAQRPGVEVRGFVEDVGPLFSRACALLVPSVAGGGLRLKAVTAMFHGLPIVSTAAGIDGLPLVDGESFLCEDRIEAYAVPMRRLLDPAFNRDVSQAAARVFERHFGREQVFREYDELFGGVSAVDEAEPLPQDTTDPVRMARAPRGSVAPSTAGPIASSTRRLS